MFQGFFRSSFRALFAPLALAVPVALVGLVGCSSKTETAAPQELRLYIWSEYIDPVLVAEFESTYSCKVVIDMYESNEQMVAKLQAGGVSQYDLVVPSDFILPSMIRLGLLQPLAKDSIPNLKNLKPEFLNPPYDTGNTYSAAYQWGTVGLIYSKPKVPDFADSWDAIFKAVPGKTPFLLMDSEREMLGVALAYLGKSMNSTDKADLEAAAKLLIETKKNKSFIGFEGGVGGKNKVAAGAAAMAIVYNGDAVKAILEDSTLGFALPKEGAVRWVDNLAIPAKAPNRDLALKFIDFILDARVGAALSNFNQYSTPNAASMPMIDSASLANPAIYPDSATSARLQFILDLGQDNQLFSETWKIAKTR
jgi:spermidine/putrescine transport system substrate-binding protein